MRLWRVTDWDEITEFYPTKKEAMGRASDLAKYCNTLDHWSSVTVIEHTINKTLTLKFLCFAIDEAKHGRNFCDGYETIWEWEKGA